MIILTNFEVKIIIYINFEVKIIIVIMSFLKKLKKNFGFNFVSVQCFSDADWCVNFTVQ